MLLNGQERVDLLPCSQTSYSTATVSPSVTFTYYVYGEVYHNVPSDPHVMCMTNDTYWFRIYLHHCLVSYCSCYRYHL